MTSRARILTILVILGCASTPERPPPAPPSPGLAVQGEVLELRQGSEGVTAWIRVEEVLRGRMHRPHLDCLLGEGWWRFPVREGKRYRFRLRSREGSVHSLVTLPWPEGIGVGEKRGLPAVEGSPDPDRKAEVLETLTERGVVEIGPALVPDLLEMLRSGDPTVRVKAARALSWVPSPAAMEDLAHLSSDPNPNIRLAAMAALREIRTDRCVPAVRMFIQDDSCRIRALAAEAMGRLRSPGCVDPLAGLLDDPDEDVRLEALRALGRVGGDRAAAGLKEFLERAGIPERLRREALDAISRTGSPVAVRLLETMETPEAIDGLGRLGLDGVPGLLQALDHEDAYLRWKSAEILRWMTGQRFGYHHDGEERDRRAARDRWRAWWRKESTR